MEKANRVAAVVVGCATYFGSVWAVGAWMYEKGEKDGERIEPKQLRVQVSRLGEEVERLEREKADCVQQLEQIRNQSGMELDAPTEDCTRLKAEVEELRVRAALKDLTPEVKARVSILASPGYWKPEMDTESPNLLKADAVYGDGDTPQPHSLTALKAIGALDDSTRGAYALFTVLAIKHDKERPRHPRTFNLAYHRGWPEKEEERQSQLTKDDGARKDWQFVKEVQEALREYGEELVDAGLLKE